MASATPISVLTMPGAIVGSDASPSHQRSQGFKGTRSQAEKAAPSMAMPTRQPNVVIRNSVQLNSGTTIRSDGENTNTNGTSAFARASRKAVLPVRNGSAPAMLAAAYAATATGG